MDSFMCDRNNGELLRALPYTDGIDWATHVDMETGRPVENPDVTYEVEPQWIMPANSGAHNWGLNPGTTSGTNVLYYRHRQLLLAHEDSLRLVLMRFAKEVLVSAGVRENIVAV